MWELLRRNDRFRKAAAWLAAVDSYTRSGDADEARLARARGERMLHVMGRVNHFAAEALRWLVPCPLFTLREIAAPHDFDAVERKLAHRVIRLGWGITPDPSDSAHWRWFESDLPTGDEEVDSLHSADAKANFAGWPSRWGPSIQTVTSVDPRLVRACRDGISSWREWFAEFQFTVETPWDQAPPGFKDIFRHHWRSLPGGSHAGEETDFFRGWDLGRTLTHACKVVDAANRCIQVLVSDLDRVRRGEPEMVCPSAPTTDGSFAVREVPQFVLALDRQDFARIIQFTRHADQHVFAIPHPLTRSDAHAIFRKLAEQVARDLPDQRELLGTPEFWGDFLAVDAIQRTERVDTSEAIRRHIRRTHVPQHELASVRRQLPPGVLDRWFVDGFLRPRPRSGRRDNDEWRRVNTLLAPILRKVDQTWRTPILKRVHYLHTLSRAAFPRLDFNLLTRLTPNKRKPPQ